MIINKDDFYTWAKEKYVEYASTTVKVPERFGDGKVKKLLSFGVYVSGGFCVMLGTAVVYEGGSFNKAQSAFNEVLNNGSY